VYNGKESSRRGVLKSRNFKMCRQNVFVCLRLLNTAGKQFCKKVVLTEQDCVIKSERFC